MFPVTLDRAERVTYTPGVDPKAEQARDHHQAAQASREDAGLHLDQRNTLVKQLHKEGWSYSRLATAVGCSPELIAKIIRPQAR